MTINYNVNGAGSSGGLGALVFGLAITVVLIVSMWKLFEKAGKPGWGCLIPFYNDYCVFDMAFGNGWLFLLMFLPIVNFIILIMLFFKLAKAFGKGIGFGFGLLFLSIVFLPILGLGDAEYDGPQ